MIRTSVPANNKFMKHRAAAGSLPQQRWRSHTQSVFIIRLPFHPPPPQKNQDHFTCGFTYYMVLEDVL